MRMRISAKNAEHLSTTYASPTPSAPLKPIRNDPIIIGGYCVKCYFSGWRGGCGFVCCTVLYSEFDQRYQDNTTNINKLNLNFQTDGAKVNVFTQNVNNNNFIITLEGSGSKGIFGGGSDSPIQFAFYNDTVNGVLTVTAKLQSPPLFQDSK